jgi:intracellular septation protein
MAFQLSDENWRRLSLRWGVFFIFLAILNEVIWRNFSTDFWVNFKVFGMLTCTVLFTLSQIPFVSRHSEDANNN